MISAWERKQSNAHLTELGVYIGFQYRHKIDSHFDLGIQSRLYNEVSSNILS
jgi:hypothetical protein